MLNFGNGDTLTFQDLTTAALVNNSLGGIRLIDAPTTPVITNPTVTVGSVSNNALNGGSGSDHLLGLGGHDELVGNGGGVDQLYVDAQITVAAAIAAGNNDNPSKAKGEWAGGGAGDDVISYCP